MNSIKTIISMIESKAIDNGLKFQNQINAEAQCKVGSEVMREKEYSEWLGKQGFNVLLHANCCKIAFNGGWESRQTEVDELTLQVAEMKSRLNDAYTDGQSAMYTARQSKVDELQASYHGEMIGHNHHLGKVKKERDELQKRVDEQGLIIAKVMSIASDHQKSWEMFEIGKKLEQALKGESNESST